MALQTRGNRHVLSGLSVSVLLLSLCPLCSGVSCDTSDPPSSSPYYKYFCGQTFVVGFPGSYSPYSWKVDASEEEDETLLYKDSLPSYATVDGWVGLDPDIMDEIANFLGFNYTVKEVELPGSNDTWTSILREYMTEIDIMGNNFALSAEREDIGLFSDKQVDMSGFLVQISQKTSSTYSYTDAFRFVTPFSSGVWLALFICMLMSAMVVWILDWSYRDDFTSFDFIKSKMAKLMFSNPTNTEKKKVVLPASDPENRPDRKEAGKIEMKQKHSNDRSQEYVANANSTLDNEFDVDIEEEEEEDLQISLFDSVYFAFASFTGAASYAPTSTPSKIFVASWSFLILIVISTYTANLAATLTQNNGYEEEIQSIDDAIQLGVKTCVSTRNVYYPSLPVGYSNTDDLAQLYPYLEVNGLWQDLYEYMANGTCRVALFNREDITASLQDQQYCDLLIVGGVSDSDGNGYADSELFYFSTGLVTNFDELELNAGINAALQYLMRSGIAQKRRKSWAGGLCTLDESSSDDDVTSVQLKHLFGPFVIHFAVGCCIILHALVRSLVIHNDIDLKWLNWFFNIHRSADEDDADAEAFSKHESAEIKLLKKLSNQMNVMEENIVKRLADGNQSADKADGSEKRTDSPLMEDRVVAFDQFRLSSKRSLKKKRTQRDMYKIRSSPSMRVLR